MAARPPILIKKYGNRRLYDTVESRYITLEELSDKIRGGTDVRVVDVKSGEDLTQPTLTQIIIEGRGAGKLLPISLLTQLIRLGDDALAEFFGRYVTGALELYLQAKRGASAVTAYNPFATLPFSAGDALARMWMSSPFGAGSSPFGAGSSPFGAGSSPFGAGSSPARRPESPPLMDLEDEADQGDDVADDVAALRREIDELRRSMESGEKKPSKAKPSRKKRRG